MAYLHTLFTSAKEENEWSTSYCFNPGETAVGKMDLGRVDVKAGLDVAKLTVS